ncbi:MAG: chemotaxis protein CheW [Pseudomonadota bacterium]|nr:chemotaxis protein CheW [Pseudomonadota bacterium]
MNASQDIGQSMRPPVADCWNKIGVHGDSSCSELHRHIHCRNCPVYSAAATQLLDADLPPDYMAHWVRQGAQNKRSADADPQSVFVFRVAAEWLALPTGVLREIVSVRTIHSIPHRRHGVVTGVANIGGQLLACFSLHQVLGLTQVHENSLKQPRPSRQFLVIQRGGHCAVCPVDEVEGIAHFQSADLRPAPVTVAKAVGTYTRSVLSWRDKVIGLLDDEALFHTVNRDLS